MANTIQKLDELIRYTIGGKVVEQSAIPLLPPGENYGSVIYKVDFKVDKEGKINEYSAVAKCPPPSPAVQKIFNTKETFKSEISWYTTVIPTLKNFAKDQGFPRELDFFQTYYGSRISLDPRSDNVDLDGVLLTENLKLRGFYNVDRHVGFDLPTAKSVLKDLALFHAVPLAIRLKDPDLFERNLKPFCPKHGGTDEESKKSYDNSTISVFDHIPELQASKDKISQCIRQCVPYGPRKIRNPSWTTILHLDFWCNNVMITGGEHSKNIILDLQVPGLGSPACDLTFFLFTSIREDVLKAQLDDLIKYYYDEFIRNLQGFKVDVRDYSFEDFLKEIEAAIKTAEYAHILGHVFAILLEKGLSNFDSLDAGNKEWKSREPNRKQIEKFRWITEEVLRRNWI